MLGSSEPTSSRKSKFEAVAQPDDVSEEDDEDEEDEEGDEEDEVSDGSADDDEGSLMGSLDEDEEDPEALSRLGAMVNGLSAQAGTKRRNEDDQGSTITEIVKKRKKNALGTERTEAIPEGEFAATSSNKDG